MNLYKINAEIELAWEQAIDPETGEINEAVYETIDSLELEKEEKIESFLCWYKNLMAEANAIKAEKLALEKDKLQQKRKQITSSGTWKRYWMARNLRQAKLKHLGERARQLSLPEMSIIFRKTARTSR